MFFAQLEEFCRLVHQEFVNKFNEVEGVSASTERALDFAETLMLCPTKEAACVWIQRQLRDALSLVLAIQNMQQQLQVGTFKLPSEAPKYQTRFFLLASTMRDYLRSRQQQSASAPQHCPASSSPAPS
jgi:hypothetical protein